MPAFKYETKGGKKLWACSFHYKDWTGKNRRKKKEGFATKKEAQEWERTFLDKTSKNPEILFSSLLENYMDDCRSRYKPTTLSTKQNIYEHKILPYFGDIKVCNIDAITIRNWQTTMINYRMPNGKPYAETYLKTIHAELSAVLNYAVRYYNLKQNPCHISGSMGKGKAGKMKIWTREQFETFIQYEERPVFHLAFNMLYYTGMREGELLALTPEDISEAKAIVRINKNFATVDSEDYFLEPKTENSNRDVTIHSRLWKEALEYTKGACIDPEDRIFYFKKSGISSEFKRITQKAGLPEIRIHDLRHSHASLLIKMKVPITEISDRLGHDNPEITLRIYSHLYPTDDESIADQIDALFEK